MNNTQATVELVAAPLCIVHLEEYYKKEKCKLDEGRIPVIPIKIASKGHSFHKVVVYPPTGRGGDKSQDWLGDASPP